MHRADEDGSISYAHLDAPIISLAAFIETADESWTNTKFSKHCLVNGTFGRVQGIELLDVGPTKKALYFTSVFVGTGSVECSKEIFDSDDFHRIFVYMCQVAYEGSYNEENDNLEGAYDVSCYQVFDKKSHGEYFPFCLEYKGVFPKNRESLNEYGIYPDRDRCYAYDYAARMYRTEKIPGENDD